MAVKKLVKKPREKEVRIIKEEMIENFIGGGGKTTEESKAKDQKDQDEEIRFTLRISAKLVNDIDKDRKGMIGNVSRNNWILSAIAEKLDK